MFVRSISEIVFEYFFSNTSRLCVMYTELKPEVSQQIMARKKNFFLLSLANNFAKLRTRGKIIIA